ncbi:MAG TPA: DNA methyltransferase [Abditibacteriaceae bacterium]|nr:DNA methyltransferase [Abditibacteriaceae bacterium]
MTRLSPSTTTTDIRHSDKRLNNPPAAIAGEGSVPPAAKFEFSAHRAPELRFDTNGEIITDAAQLPGVAKLPPDERAALLQYIEQLQNAQPWLEWSGKREQPGFVVDPVALHVHERVSTQAILNMARREDVQRSLFADADLPYEQEIEFYKHEVDWSNRLILGDSLQVMASLARRENLAGAVQMIYLDPPYGIKFASNFQPQIGQRDVKDKDSDLTREPETVKAYRDTWQLGIHSYLTYLRDRLLLCRELLTDSGSIFVQISDENLHRVRCLMDEVFGAENFCGIIVFSKTSGLIQTLLHDRALRRLGCHAYRGLGR